VLLISKSRSVTRPGIKEIELSQRNADPNVAENGILRFFAKPRQE
jgi:hypothetical protein